MKLVRSISKRLPWVLALVAAVSAVGCADPAPEPKGASTAKLLAPRAVFKAKASPVSQSAYGITEWRMYRGKRDIILTGYDVKGKPVKGLSVGFHSASTSGGDAVLRARLLDGSLFAARHVYGGASSSNKKIGQASDKFLRTALRDIQAVNASLAAQMKSTTGKQSIQPQTFPIPSGGACGADMTQILLQAITCVMSSGGSDPKALMQCFLAAQAAGGAGGACTPADPSGGGGMPTDPYDPTGGGTGGLPGGPYDPSGGGGGGPGGDPSGGGAYPEGDPSGGGGGYPGYPGGDPAGGGGYPDDGMGGGTPGGGAGTPGGGGYPGDIEDPYGDGSMCPSCAGDGADIYSDPYGGGVGYEDEYGGGFGAGY